MAKSTKSVARALSRSAARGASAAARAAPAGSRQGMMDGLQNVLSGLGTEKDKAFSTFFGYNFIDRSQLDAAYRGDWIARKGIDIPAYDSTREWRTWQADPDDVSLIENTEKKFRVQLKTMRAMCLGRLYGGGAMIIGCDTGVQEEPLDPLMVKEGDLKFLHAVSRFDLTIGDIEWDITSPWYGRPKWYTPAQTNDPTLANLVRLHPSRVVTFTGNEIPDINMAQGWGDSIMQTVSDAVMSAGVTHASVTQMVSEAKLDVIKIPGLSQQITSTEYENALKKRFSFANIAKSVFGILLLDAAEEWERIDTQFAGLPDVEKMALLVASGAFDIPATRFLSQSPAGLSSTGESDTRNYYDRLSTEQKVFIQPAIEPLDIVLLRSSLGDVPEDEMKDMWYSWNPLWQVTAKEKSEIAKSKADTFKIDVDAGLLNEVVLKKAREAQLIADETYPGLQQIIDDFDDDPELVQAGIAEEQAAAEQAALLAQGGAVNPNAPKQLKGPPNAKQIAPPKAQPKKALVPPGKKPLAKAVDGMVRRINDAMRPRSLYVHRDLLNGKDLAKWARAQGFKSVIEDFHVTVIYSKAPVDWLKIGSDEFRSEPDGDLIVKAGGPRVIEKFGDAVVLCFANSDLQYRHRSMMYRGEDDGISYDYEEYNPHVTITYEGGAIDLENVKPYTGELRFGPELFEEIRGSYTPTEEKAFDAQFLSDWMSHNDGHHPDTGKFASAPHAGTKKEAKHFPGMSNEEKLANAEVMYGVGSDRYAEALRRYGPKDTAIGLAQLIRDMAPPQVHVTVETPASSRSRKKRVTVTKRDGRGRPEETIVTDIEE